MKNFLTIALFFCVMLIQAQESQKLQDNQFKINILSPGFTYEKGVSASNSINLDANVSIGYSTQANSNSNFVAGPYIRSQFRHYYNLKKRALKEKNTTGNSGNFIAANASYYFKPFDQPNLVSVYDGVTLGATWGFQRTFKRGLNINLNTGVGYNFASDQSSSVVPLINFTIGWVLFKN
jgi:hypothetical protein